MKPIRNIFFCLMAALIFSGSADAASLDDLYRDIIRSDNEGYLPLYVKNRAMPDVLGEENILKKIPADEESKLKSVPEKPLNLTNDSQQQEIIRRGKQLKWEQTLKAVQENKVTPLELEEINQRAAMADGKAIEVLAWMYAKGIGVQPNLAEAFKLYRIAESLRIEGAAANAAAVYKAMTPEQRALLKK